MLILTFMYLYSLPHSEAFQSVMSVTLNQLHHSGWFSFSLYKMVLSLAVSANHAELAADFAR